MLLNKINNMDYVIILSLYEDRCILMPDHPLLPFKHTWRRDCLIDGNGMVIVNSEVHSTEPNQTK